ncbi:OmpA family protein [Maribacter sp. TH_r10]|uniref:OmpA family protein n=1 Tax=Maribacter sp. TH_r10 TaxID=3082086 RepID=UPI002955581C|nr:OmpA family protein [Maribacter sp. TH_r10]MDV7139644.1 OmpA family protein [Maribacter sp. TH_r10]
MVKTVQGAPLQIDVSANFMSTDKFTLGASYRWDAAVSALFGFQISDKLMLGLAYDKETGDALYSADVVIFDSNDQIVTETKTDGSFEVKGNCVGSDYKIVASKSDYETGDKTFTTLEAQDTSGVDLALEKTRKTPINTELISYLNIEPIYFDFDKFNVRKDAETSLQKNITFLNEYPEVRIEVSSHTDSRAIDSYNLSLSQKRANSTIEYLIQKGVNPDRLAQKGFGETKLTNECSNNVPCSKVKHQANRRSEFVVIE